MSMKVRTKICLLMASFSVLLLANYADTAQAAPIAQDVAIVNMVGFDATDFEITSPGTYVATLIDRGWPRPFDFLGLSVDTVGEELALLFSPGTMQFNVGGSISSSNPLHVTATVAWDTVDELPIGKYLWSITAIPEPASILLLGSGVFGLAVLKAGRGKGQP